MGFPKSRDIFRGKKIGISGEFLRRFANLKSAKTFAVYKELLTQKKCAPYCKHCSGNASDVDANSANENLTAAFLLRYGDLAAVW